MKYTAPVESTLFLLKDVLGFDNELTEPILTEAAKLCEEEIAPTNQEGDKEGARYWKHNTALGDTAPPEVSVPQCFHEPYRKFCEGGWIGLSVPEVYGGQGLPFTLAVATNEMVSSANMAWSLYPGITRGAIQALLTHGSEVQKKCWIPYMASGEWTGTMCLTEPHCGTDLGLLKTKAVWNEEGTEPGYFSITGQKIFISGGDHDLTENILHLVLARVEGDPEGVKGISMFAVPKMLDNGRNNVSAGSIEEKMGIHGSPTCVMNFDGAHGWLVGERCKGLQAMFVMMNEMRLGCAIHGLSQSELAYQNAVEYAKERLQGTKLSELRLGENTTRTPCSIIHHPDVRRHLLDVRCINEAARLLVLEAATLVDVVNADGSTTDLTVEADIKRQKEEAEDRLGLMTPVLKGVLTDYGVENAIKMQQVWGGHGYIRENGMEQIVRDARIAMIYEGTNSVQALDLVGRKLPKNMGRAIRKFLEDATDPQYKAISEQVYDLKLATEWLVRNAVGNPNNAGFASYDYMKMMGLIMLGMAHCKIVAKTDDKTRHDNAKYFVERILPETSFLLNRIHNGSDTMMGATF